MNRLKQLFHKQQDLWVSASGEEERGLVLAYGRKDALLLTGAASIIGTDFRPEVALNPFATMLS
jgi:hypothetical protein